MIVLKGHQPKDKEELYRQLRGINDVVCWECDSTPEIGDFKFVKKFAILPKLLYRYDLGIGDRYKKMFIWFRHYYKVYRYTYKTWTVPPSIGWSMQHYADKKLKDVIIRNQEFLGVYGNGAVFKNRSEADSALGTYRQHYEERLKAFNEDKFLQGFVQGLKTGR